MIPILEKSAFELKVVLSKIHSVFIAPPVTARHLWIFVHILNGHILGDVLLHVHGNTVARNFATIFDGSTSWVGTTLSSRDCLIAPTNCRDGLSIGFKIKLTGLTKSPEQRYIVDTGVFSMHTRGIAIYLQHGKLFCVVMTMHDRRVEGLCKISYLFLFPRQ
jgi:hypothetical protein